MSPAADTPETAATEPFDVNDRWTGRVKFTAQIALNIPLISLKLRAAVEWALDNGADLRDADLRGADLRDANLRDANLGEIKADFLSEALRLPNELEALREALIAGRVDGSTYKGECACLAGTLAHARGDADYDGSDIQLGAITFHANPSSPREQWFSNIRRGDTPLGNQFASIALDWTNEAIAMRDLIRAKAAA